MGNIIHDLILGKNYEYGDQEFLRFKKLIDSTLKDVCTNNQFVNFNNSKSDFRIDFFITHQFQFVSVPMLLVDRYPIVRFLLPTYYRYCKNGFALQHFFLKHIEEHEKAIVTSTNEDNEPNDFIDAYLRNMIKYAEGRQYK